MKGVSTGEDKASSERIIILMLGVISAVCILGIILLEVFNHSGQSQALQTIASLCVGALASRISQQLTKETKQEDDLSVIGRAATRSIIAQAMRQLGDDDLVGKDSLR